MTCSSTRQTSSSPSLERSLGFASAKGQDSHSVASHAAVRRVRIALGEAPLELALTGTRSCLTKLHIAVRAGTWVCSQFRRVARSSANRRVTVLAVTTFALANG